MSRVLKDKDTVVVTQPECGRTWNKKNHQFSESGRKRIGRLANYIGWLAIISKVPVLLVWIEDGEDKLPTQKLFSWPRFRNPITIKIGELIDPVSLGIFDADDFTKLIAEKLLALADLEQ